MDVTLASASPRPWGQAATWARDVGRIWAGCPDPGAPSCNPASSLATLAGLHAAAEGPAKTHEAGPIFLCRSRTRIAHEGMLRPREGLPSPCSAPMTSAPGSLTLLFRLGPERASGSLDLLFLCSGMFFPTRLGSFKSSAHISFPDLHHLWTSPGMQPAFLFLHSASHLRFLRSGATCLGRCDGRDLRLLQTAGVPSRRAGWEGALPCRAAQRWSSRCSVHRPDCAGEHRGPRALGRRGPDLSSGLSSISWGLCELVRRGPPLLFPEAAANLRPHPTGMEEPVEGEAQLIPLPPPHPPTPALR